MLAMLLLEVRTQLKKLCGSRRAVSSNLRIEEQIPRNTFSRKTTRRTVAIQMRRARPRQIYKIYGWFVIEFANAMDVSCHTLPRWYLCLCLRVWNGSGLHEINVSEQERLHVLFFDFIFTHAKILSYSEKCREYDFFLVVFRSV